MEIKNKSIYNVFIIIFISLNEIKKNNDYKEFINNTFIKYLVLFDVIIYLNI